MRAAFRDGWSFGLWLFSVFMILSLSFSLWAAFDIKVAVLSFIFLAISVLFLSRTSPLQIRIDSTQLYVGNAHIERRYVGEVKVLSASQMAQRRTRDADPRAYLQLRFWVKQGIEIEIKDVRDPHPYWLVSSRHGEKIAELLKTNGRASSKT